MDAYFPFYIAGDAYLYYYEICVGNVVCYLDECCLFTHLMPRNYLEASVILKIDVFQFNCTLQSCPLCTNMLVKKK